MRRPEMGAVVRMMDTWGDGSHLCTVVDLLDTQFRATYEVARADGGWTEHSMFAFYNAHGDKWSEEDAIRF